MRYYWYYKACTKHFPVRLCTTQLAQSTSQYDFAQQSLHTVLPSTALYYKACTKDFPVLPCTTKLAQSTSQYCFVLQSSQKEYPGNTLYYKACTKHVPVQRLHCVLQRHVANPHLCTHMEPKRDDNHAAITLRSATRDSTCT